MTIYNFEYALSDLRQKIADVINQSGAGFVTGDTIPDATTSHIITKATVFAAVDKLVRQTVMLGTGSETASLSITNTDVINAVDKLLRDYTPKVNSTSTTDTIDVVINNVVQAVDLYVKDNVPRVQSSKTADASFDYTYDVTELIPKIDKILKDSYPKLNATGLSSHDLTFVLVDLVSKVDKMVIDMLPNESDTKTSWGAVTISNTTLIRNVELRIKDKAPKIGTQVTAGSMTITTSSLIDKVNSLLEDWLPTESSTATSWTAKTYTKSTLIANVELMIKDAIPSVSGNSSITPTFTITVADLLTKSKANSAYYAKKNPELFENIAVTDDESAIMGFYYKEGLKEIESVLNNIISTVTDNGTSIVFTFATGYEIDTYLQGLLSKRIETALADYMLYRWLGHIGINELANMHRTEFDNNLKFCETVTLKKYETLSYFIDNIAGLVSEKIQDMLTSYSALVFTWKSSRLSTSSRTGIEAKISDIITSYAANMWLNKLGLAQVAPSRLNELELYMHDKYTNVSVYIESAFNIVSTRLERILSGAITGGTTYTIPYITTPSLTTTSIDVLKKQIEDNVTRFAANIWAQNVGINQKFETSWDELDFYSLEKHESISYFNKTIASLVSEKIQNILTDFNSSTLTYTFADSRFSTATRNTITELITDIICDYSTANWINKMGGNASYVNRLPELEPYIKEKYDTIASYIDDTFNTISTKINTILSDSISFSLGTYTATITSTDSITTSSSAALSNLIQDIVVRHVATKWASAIGLSTQYEVPWSELDNYIQEKYESLELFISQSLYKVQDKTADLLNSALSYSGTTYTLSLTNTYNLSSIGRNSFFKLIEDIVIQYSANKWANKIGIQAIAIEKWEDLDKYMYEKYETISQSVKTIVNEINTKLEYILSADVAFSNSTYTFSLASSKNNNSISYAGIERIVNNIVNEYASNSWLIKLGLQPNKTIDLSVLDRFTYNKQESIVEFTSQAIHMSSLLLNYLQPSYTYTSGTETHAVSYTVANNMSGTDAAMMINILKDYIFNYVAINWAEKTGIKHNIVLKPEMFVRYNYNKYDTYIAAFDSKVTDIQTALNYIVTTGYVLTTSNVTYTTVQLHNFDSQSVSNIKNLIENYFINIVAFEWLVKIESNTAPKFANEANKIMLALGQYNVKKRLFVDTELKRAAYRIFDNFSFIGAGLERPVLYDESHDYSLKSSLSDGVNTFDIAAQTIDATGKIYYWFLMHGNWETSNQYTLDILLDDALITYVLREYFRNKPDRIQDYQMNELRFKNLISDIRMNLFARTKGNRTKRDSEFI